MYLEDKMSSSQYIDAIEAISQLVGLDSRSTPQEVVDAVRRIGLGLTFGDLRDANVTRAKRWQGDDEVPLDFAMMELAGEVGEACNAAKKIARLRRGWKGGQDMSENLAEELADVVICADLAAINAGINLEKAVADKFNATSKKHDFPERLNIS